VVQFEGTHRLCYIRGPEGILIGLAPELGQHCPQARQWASAGGAGTHAADVLRDLGRERVPDATTLLKFRRLLEKHRLGEARFGGSWTFVGLFATVMLAWKR